MQTKDPFLLLMLCLALIIPIMFPSISAAGQERDAGALDALREREAALDAEGAQLEQEFLDIIHRGKSTRMRPAMKRVSADLKEHAGRLALYLERESAFEKDWYKYHGWLGDSPEVESFKARKASLDAEREELLEKYSELVGANQSQLNRKRKLRYYRQDLRAIEEQYLAYRSKRDAFEKDWEDYYAIRRSVK
jgi:hypothetical protein